MCFGSVDPQEIQDQSHAHVASALRLIEIAGSWVIVDLDGAALTPDAQLYYAADITGDDPWEWVFTGGEDHTLLGTTDKEPPAGYRVWSTITRNRSPSSRSPATRCARSSAWISHGWAHCW